jgi:hypothetical protein
MFSFRDLIEQIKLFNKYNRNQRTNLTYEFDENTSNSTEIKIQGLLKIHWNLKNPIKLLSSPSDASTTNEQIQNSFRTTSIKHLNEKRRQQTGWDDSSLFKTDQIDTQALFRSQTVKCKSIKSKPRPTLNSIVDMEKNESEMFVPNYASVSNICIDNQITCIEAIKILLEKYQVNFFFSSTLRFDLIVS